MDVPRKTCCTPTSGAFERQREDLRSFHRRRVSASAARIPGGQALVGTAAPQIQLDGESPLKKVKVDPFTIGATAVTNQQFSQFIEDTGYTTDAEHYGWSFVFHSQISNSLEDTQSVPGVEWWLKVHGARWDKIDGHAPPPPEHPVVHVSWNDARAYCAWVGGRLPTEAEWEHAARGGLGDVLFPWGNSEPNDVSEFRCNIWQGHFPRFNSARDGYEFTAPARSFEPNNHGLYNMVGNVWEWTAEPFRLRSLKKAARAQARNMQGYKLLKGGSFLCHKSYCYRYRIAARTGNSPESTTSHQGFRVVWPNA